jgi:hypothetical protein
MATAAEAELQVRSGFLFRVSEVNVQLAMTGGTRQRGVFCPSLQSLNLLMAFITGLVWPCGGFLLSGRNGGGRAENEE